MDAEVARGLDDLQIGGDGFEPPGNVRKRDRNDVLITDGDHIAEVPLANQLHCARAKAGRQHPVRRAGGAAALEMPRHRHADFPPGALADFLRNAVGDGRERHVGARRLEFLLAHRRFLHGNGALRHGEDAEAFLQIISGEKPVDYFDTFVVEWYANGGKELTEQVQNAYESGKD